MFGFLEHPLTRGRDLDDPGTTQLRRQIIQGKGFLRRLYREWYERIAARLPVGEGRVLELGSGGGFLGDVVPGVVTSDVFRVPDISLVLAGERLPVRDGALRAIVMTNVFHHLRDAAAFMAEAARAIRPGGRLVMIEPWNTRWGAFVYRHFHHEPFDAGADWRLGELGGPLTGANGALPWIVFDRDRARLEAALPWRVARVEPMMPVAYLVSGGVSLRALAPGFAYRLVRMLEQPAARAAGMFALIIVERVSA